MSRLKNRVERLEGTGQDGPVMIYASYPDNEQRRAALEKEARNLGYRPPFEFALNGSMTAFQASIAERLGNKPAIHFIGTHSEYSAMWRRALELIWARNAEANNEQT